MKLRVAICAARWHSSLVDNIISLTVDELKNLGITSIEYTYVPGSLELVFAASKSIQTKFPDVIVCFGVLLQGDTFHFEQVSNAVSKGLMDVQLAKNIPIVNCVQSCYTVEQAQRRTTGDMSAQLAKSYALTAVQMALYNK